MFIYVYSGVICVGWVRTPLVEKQIDARAVEKKISKEEAIIDLLQEKEPSLRFSHVEHIGAMVVFLCSEAASNMTGVSIPMDGGWTAQ